MKVLRLQGTDVVSKIDDDLGALLLSSNWRLDRHGYVLRKLPCGRREFLHRAVIAAPAELCVDHIDRDPLNNQRSNLRLVTRAENNLNKTPRAGSSRFRGVAWVPKWSKWQVYVNRTYIGGFADELAAAAAWLEAAAPVYGEVNVAKDRATLAACLESRG